MRLRVVCDETGRILAAAELDDGGLTILPEPVDAQHAAVDVDVPYEHRKSDLADLCRSLRVDRERNRLVPLE